MLGQTFVRIPNSKSIPAAHGENRVSTGRLLSLKMADLTIFEFGIAEVA